MFATTSRASTASPTRAPTPTSPRTARSRSPTGSTHSIRGPARARPAWSPTLGPDASYTGNPFFSNRATFDTPQQLLDTLKQFPFGGQTTTSALPAPACTKQPQQPSIGQIAEMSDYTHVYANP